MLVDDVKNIATTIFIRNLFFQFDTMIFALHFIVKEKIKVCVSLFKLKRSDFFLIKVLYAYCKIFYRFLYCISTAIAAFLVKNKTDPRQLM